MNKTSSSWERIFEQRKFDLGTDLHFISADEIKDITGKEPRILAKFDDSKSLPDVFKRNGYFLLPVKNGEYAIVRGNGFHKLEKSSRKSKYKSKIEFPLTTAGRGQSEMQYLDYAFNAGALEAAFKVGPLYQSIRGREYSKPFGFRVSKSNLKTESVQMEVDSGLEGRESIVLVEAKIGKPDDFIIRQLFYPYRHFQIISSSKTIIPVFFTYELDLKVFNLWIYDFADKNDYNSIYLSRKQAFEIVVDDPIELDAISPKKVVNKELVPQANDLNKVIELVFKISEGVNEYQSVATYFSFNERQSSYYREAAEALGLVKAIHGRYYLTETGEKLVTQSAEKRHLFVIELLSDFYLVRAGMEILTSKGKLTKSDLERLIRKHSKLTGTTVGRRASSLSSWFRWIGDHTAGFVTTDAGFVIHSKR